MLRRLLPHPLLTLLLTAVWLLLLNDFTVGALVFGLVLGILVPLFTRMFWPEAPRMHNFPGIVEYFVVVLWDIVVANFLVAYLVLFRPAGRLRSRFLVIPLDIRSPEAISVLAGTITLTPGTVSSDLSSDGRNLLVHALDVVDPEAAVATIKHRYERRLKEIFE